MADFRKQTGVRRSLASMTKNKVISTMLPTTKDGQIAEIDAGLTEIYTYFTTADGNTHEVLAADGWTRVRLLLETAGPVAIGTRQTLAPLLTGRGRILPVGLEIELELKKGDRLYIIAGTVNRVSVTIQRIPYGDRVISRIDQVRNAIASVIGAPSPDFVMTGPGIGPVSPTPQPRGIVLSKRLRKAIAKRKFPRTRMR